VQDSLVHVLATVRSAQFTYGVINSVEDSLSHSFADPVEEIHRFSLHTIQGSDIAQAVVLIRRVGPVHYRETSRMSRRDFDDGRCKPDGIRPFLPFSQETELASGPASG